MSLFGLSSPSFGVELLVPIHEMSLNFISFIALTLQWKEALTLLTFHSISYHPKSNRLSHLQKTVLEIYPVS